jgi:single-strand DNA-binding protein
MNKVILMGRLTKDPDIRYSQGEKSTAVARFSLAVDRKFKQEGQPTADFINCLAFGKRAEFIEKYCRKGTKLVVEGSWQTGSYTNKDGNKVYTNECLIENCEFAESKAAAQNSQPAEGSSPSSAAGDGFMNIPVGIDEELPFN